MNKNKVKQFMALGVSYLDQYVTEYEVKDGYIKELYEFVRRDLFDVHNKSQEQAIKSVDKILDKIIEIQGKEIKANVLALSISSLFVVFELGFWKGSKALKAKRLLWGIYNKVERDNYKDIGFRNSNELISKLEYAIK